MSQELLDKIIAAIPVAKQVNNNWAVEFLTSIKQQLESPRKRRRGLSDRQLQYVESTLERLSPENLKHEEGWEDEWNNNAELRKRAEVIADYYGQTTYYSNSVSAVKIALLENKVPRRRSIIKMIENKYAQKVWDSYTSEPKWKVGDFVKVRTNADFSRIHFSGPNSFAVRRYQGYNDDQPVLSETTCVILEVNSRPIDKALAYNKSAGGCRYYKVLPIGHALPFDIIEKDLKRPSKKEIS